MQIQPNASSLATHPYPPSDARTRPASPWHTQPAGACCSHRPDIFLSRFPFHTKNSSSHLIVLFSVTCRHSHTPSPGAIENVGSQAMPRHRAAIKTAACSALNGRVGLYTAGLILLRARCIHSPVRTSHTAHRPSKHYLTLVISSHSTIHSTWPASRHATDESHLREPAQQISAVHSLLHPQPLHNFRHSSFDAQ